MADRTVVAHLLRRATFGPTAAEVDAALAAGSEATIAALLTPVGADVGAAATPLPNVGPTPSFKAEAGRTAAERSAAQQARQDQIQAIVDWWITRMVAARHQFTEKLIFFWHGHWATSVQKVKSGPVMLHQLETFRRDGHGPFGTLLHSMLRDPALVFWLDGEYNTSRAPNENLARELMELFTLGIGSYTEEDVKQAARALTGWVVDREAMTSSFIPRRHDAGIKTILGFAQRFDVDSLATLLLAQPASAAFIARRLWFRFASTAAIPITTQARMIAAYGRRGDVTAMMRALLTDSAFAATHGQLVKQPVEWVIGALRQLAIDPARLTDDRRAQLRNGLDALGQLPLQPPSVGGWPAGSAWLTTSSTQTKVRLATSFARATSPTVLTPLANGNELVRLDALARLLCVDAWTDRTKSALRLALGDPRTLLTVGLISPEYAVS